MGFFPHKQHYTCLNVELNVFFCFLLEGTKGDIQLFTLEEALKETKLMSHEAHFRAVLGSKLKKGMYYTLNLKLKFKGDTIFLVLVTYEHKAKNAKQIWKPA